MSADRNGGTVPENFKDLINLPGVSYYSAGAVRCFAWNYPEAIIDTNTMRIVCRIFNKTVVDSLRRNKGFMDLMKLLVCRRDPRRYNYAMLDLAYRNCFNKKVPECISCPLVRVCNYNEKIPHNPINA